MMVNQDIDDFEYAIEEIQKSTQRVASGKGSEDTPFDQIQALGRTLGLACFGCEGFNEYRLDRVALDALSCLGEIQGDKYNPKLVVPNPVDEYDPIVIPIVNPTRQYPEDEY